MLQNYTGNAMFNNALMTIEALSEVSSVSELTPERMLDLYNRVKLKDLNKRMKSYTMLFSKNGPLHNDAENGDRVYDSLMKTIFHNFDNSGSKICEISGLRFEKCFSDLFKESLRAIGFSSKEIEKKDTNIGRIWFPLIGGLGSDAQALPQAKFAVQIHPICIAVLQFLPLSSLLYKGGVLLIDSSNFRLARTMVAENTNRVRLQIENTPVSQPVENIRDYSKGDYLLKVLNKLSEKEEWEETFSDLNMWSFSNSGTGASCEIDRVPNKLIKKLQALKRNTLIGKKIEQILSSGDKSFSFLESLEDDKEWFLLYPQVFGSGKKAVKYDGVSTEFLEAYYAQIGKVEFIPIAKYVAKLAIKYKSKSFESFLQKTTGWDELEYRIELFKVLVRAAENGEWSMHHQISILSDPNKLPIQNTFFHLHKLVHFYVQKKIDSAELPEASISDSKVFQATTWLIALIEKDARYASIKARLQNGYEFQNVNFGRVIIDAVENNDIDVYAFIEILYDEDFQYKKAGLAELLRLFFSQRTKTDFESVQWKTLLHKDRVIEDWLKKVRLFAEEYQSYYHNKYRNRTTGEPPIKKFSNTVDAIINDKGQFYSILNEMVNNTNQYLGLEGNTNADKWTMDDLMTGPLGSRSQHLSANIIKFYLKKLATRNLNQKQICKPVNQNKNGNT